MSGPDDRRARRAKALGILAGAAVAAAGVAITLVGGLLGRRSSEPVATSRRRRS